MNCITKLYHNFTARKVGLIIRGVLIKQLIYNGCGFIFACDRYLYCKHMLKLHKTATNGKCQIECCSRPPHQQDFLDTGDW